MSEPADSAKHGRKATVNNLIDAILNHFPQAVKDAGIEDANQYWDSVSIYVEVESDPQVYYENARKKHGDNIDLNLRSFAPRLYNFVESYSGVVGTEQYLSPEAIPDEENVYDGCVYLIDLKLM